MTAITICGDFAVPPPPQIKYDNVFPSISHEVMETDAMILVFWMLAFKSTFSGMT